MRCLGESRHPGLWARLEWDSDNVWGQVLKPTTSACCMESFWMTGIGRGDSATHRLLPYFQVDD